MAKTKVRSELAERVIDFLIRKASESGGKRFRLRDHHALTYAYRKMDMMVYGIFSTTHIFLTPSPEEESRRLKERLEKILSCEIIPKAIITEDDSVLEFTKNLNEYLTLNDVKSIVIDVIGLHERYATQIEIYKNGVIVYSPSKNRNEEDVKAFVECLSLFYYFIV